MSKGKTLDEIRDELFPVIDNIKHDTEPIDLAISNNNICRQNGWDAAVKEVRAREVEPEKEKNKALVDALEIVTNCLDGHKKSSCYYFMDEDWDALEKARKALKQYKEDK